MTPIVKMQKWKSQKREVNTLLLKKGCNASKCATLGVKVQMAIPMGESSPLPTQKIINK
jgi:hypothetical protein